ncbi:MAG: hypothetical protein A2W31_11520 [Planctomycetes bacterium RBG_16_64_10]|nr:MAG: hypothetical protein A2W31_11520 [Planctomycetes bacterium RBG_16_64_10]
MSVPASVIAEAKRLGLPLSQCTVGGVPLAATEEKGRLPAANARKVRSKTELLYMHELERQRAAGEIVRYRYEGLRFQLLEHGQPKKTYEPDWVAWLPDGRIRCIEIKPRRYIFRENDARAVYLWAKQQWGGACIEFIALRRTDSGWREIWNDDLTDT